MEFSLNCKNAAYPCEVTLDEDNGRYMIRNADTSGEVFNTKEELLTWLSESWDEADFENPKEYQQMMEKIQKELSE
ncbi:hypothetical protein EJF36_17935 [Bacillus sp. HMF5848]|nr:hypothetical protein EJF36_17935 [Bacillus sp. HMF5848]